MSGEQGTGAMTQRDHRGERRWLRMLGALSWDVAVGLIVAALVVATLLFASGISQFVYVDF